MTDINDGNLKVMHSSVLVCEINCDVWIDVLCRPDCVESLALGSNINLCQGCAINFQIESPELRAMDLQTQDRRIPGNTLSLAIRAQPETGGCPAKISKPPWAAGIPRVQIILILEIIWSDPKRPHMTS
jgi:hypothetical protein